MILPQLGLTGASYRFRAASALGSTFYRFGHFGLAGASPPRVSSAAFH